MGGFQLALGGFGTLHRLVVGLPCFFLPGIGGVQIFLQLGVLLAQPCYIRSDGFQMALSSIGPLLLGFDLRQKFLHPLAVSGGFDHLRDTPAAGDEVQIFAGQLGQLF